MTPTLAFIYGATVTASPLLATILAFEVLIRHRFNHAAPLPGRRRIPLIRTRRFLSQTFWHVGAVWMHIASALAPTEQG